MSWRCQVQSATVSLSEILCWFSGWSHVTDCKIGHFEPAEKNLLLCFKDTWSTIQMSVKENTFFGQYAWYSFGSCCYQFSPKTCTDGFISRFFFSPHIQNLLQDDDHSLSTSKAYKTCDIFKGTKEKNAEEEKRSCWLATVLMRKF